jgi:hypothetical protein
MSIKPIKISLLSGVALEGGAVTLAFLFLYVLPFGLGIYSVILAVLDQASLLYFSHCLAHFIVGRFFGIRFRYFLFGPSALSRAEPAVLRRVGRLLLTFIIVVDKNSLIPVSNGKIATMHYAGTTTSMVLPFLVSAGALLRGDLTATLASTLFAFANILFTLTFSPKTGDISRARSPRADRAKGN